MHPPPASSFKLLELTIASANDLPPVSKMLRTFAVAYITPDHKLTTRIDHTGHTNPAWNYKVAFHVDDLFLKSESSAVTIEIYNLAWLRDLPIGTCRLLISSLSPPLAKNPAFRRVPLRVCRPSGHMQGTLHIGVQLVGRGAEDEICEEDGVVKDEDQEQNHHGNVYYYVGEELLQEQDNKNPLPARGPSPIPSPMSRATSMPKSEPETRTIATSTGSLYSVMRPLPSEVAADLKKGLYSAADWKDYGSSVFEGWTEEGDRSEDRGVGPTYEPWPTVEEPMGPPSPERRFAGWQGKRRPDNKKNKKKGLFSCFGNAYGFQFSIVCGSKGLKKKKKKKNSRNVNIHLMSHSEDNQHRYYYV